MTNQTLSKEVQGFSWMPISGGTGEDIYSLRIGEAMFVIKDQTKFDHTRYAQIPQYSDRMGGFRLVRVSPETRSADGVRHMSMGPLKGERLGERYESADEVMIAAPKLIEAYLVKECKACEDNLKALKEAQATVAKALGN